MDEIKKDAEIIPPVLDEEKEKALKAEAEKVEAEKVKKAEELLNLNKAIIEAQSQLREIRKEKHESKQKKEEVKGEEEIPQIDFNDPSVKAWEKHIKGSINPLQVEIEKGKEERREFALKQFLKDKPSLAKNPDKLKELMFTYEKLRNASETTVEGILLDLDKSFVVVYRDELVKAARERITDEAQADALFFDIAVSRGSTSYPTQKESIPVLDEDSKQILAKWGMTQEEWQGLKKKYK